MSRCVRLAFALGLGALLFASPAGAADLRVDFAELARLVQSITAGAKVRLHNVPGGLLNLDPGSVVTVGSTQKSLRLEPRSFQIFGSSYAYFVNDINSTEIRVTPVAGAVRLSFKFEADGPELIGDCVSGSCSFENVMPDIEWSNPGLTVDLVPVRFNGSVSLQVKAVKIEGRLDPVCRSAVGLISSSVCSVALPWARRTIARLQGQLSGTLQEKVNDTEMQQELASNLKRYLTLGPAGEVQISNVAVDARGILVSFRFAN